MNDIKKTSILAILDILKKYSSEDKPITYEQIITKLDNDYNIILERRAVGRNIAALKDFGYDIETGRLGAYLTEREFDDSELKLLIDGVLSNRYIPASNSKVLMEKLMDLADSKLKQHTKYVYNIPDWTKTPNREVFLNIELIDEAIATEKQIEFDYCIFDQNKDLVKRHEDKKSIVSPYRMVVKNQRYYLMCKNMERQALTYYKIDKIMNVKILDKYSDDINTLPSFNNGINNKVLSSALPYMFSDIPVQAEVKVLNNYGIDLMVDWFGKEVKFTQKKDNTLYATIKVSPQAMKYFALQYMSDIQVVAPQSLIEGIREELNHGKMYFSNENN